VLEVLSFRVIRAACVCSFIQENLLVIRYFINRFQKFQQIYNFGALGDIGDNDELIRFWGQKVKGQSHNQTKYGQNPLLRPFCQNRTLNNDSLNWIELDVCWWFCNFGHIWGQTKYGQKGGGIRINGSASSSIYTVKRKNTPKCFCHIFQKTLNNVATLPFET